MRERETPGRPRAGTAIAATAIALACAAPAVAVALGGSAAVGPPSGSTLDARIVGTGPLGPYRRLGIAPGEPYLTREDGIAKAHSGRSKRRRSLIYFSQLSDFQLADEESPARVEFLDPDDNPAPFNAAWRPWESLMPQTVDAAIRQVDRFVPASTVADGRGRRARMAFALTTGDSADNQQRNEVQWVVRLLEGGTIDPNSGSSDTSRYNGFCQAEVGLGNLVPGEAAHYTGVQDYNDYDEGADPAFYDPNDPRGTKFGSWPKYPGLMDRSEAPFQAEGLHVPSYVVFGNHDGLVQGNQSANAGIESVATGCIKPYGPIGDPRDLGGTLSGLNQAALQSLLSSDPSRAGLVPPDPRRQLVSKPQYKALHATARQPDAHGFGFIDKGQLAASRGAAGYYAWSPRPSFRFIGLDTVSEAGVTGQSADGNVDDPQFRWLEGELKRATARDEIIVLFSHHAIASLTADVPDEDAPPCTNPNAVAPPDSTGPGHDSNPGCDLDPRDSRPIHLGADLTALLHRYPHVVAWVAGHSHVNDVEPFRSPKRGGFWSVRSAAEADWPQQTRLIDLMDNRDGTLSIFGTILDHASAAATPASGTSAGAFGKETMAALARTFSYNDQQVGANPAFGASHGEGERNDRNVELIVGDPRRSTAGVGRCAAATASLRGKSVGRARLGRRRATNRRAFPRTSLTRPRRTIDRFCFVGGGAVRVGYPSRGFRARMSRRERRRVKGRAVLVLTSRERYRVKGVRPGASVRTMRRRIRGERRFKVGRNTWYLARGKHARIVFKTRGGKVREIGLADRRLTRSRRGARRFLRAFSL